MKSGFVVLVLCLVGSVFAQTSNPLSIKECVDIALKNNSQLRMAEQDVQIAGTSIMLSRSAWLPSVDLSSSAGYYIQGARSVSQDVPVGIDPETGDYVYEQQKIRQDKVERDSYSASLSVNQNIYDFGRTTNSIKEAKSYQQVYQHYLMNQKNAVIAQVKDAFYTLLQAYELKDVYTESLKAAEENLEYNESALQIGLKSQAEIYSARVRVGTAKESLIQQKNSIEFAKADLNNALGLSPDNPIEILRDEKSPTFPDYDFKRAVEIALENNENLKALQHELEAQEFAIKAAKARYAPTFGFGLSYRRDNDDPGRVYSTKLNEDFAVTMGVGVDLNIFNGFADKAQVQRQVLSFEKSLENLKEQKRIMIVGLKQYFLALEAYKNIIDINKTNLEAYQENLRLQQEKRRIGSGTELEVTEAQSLVTQAQESLVRAEFNAKISGAQLEAVLGIIETE